MKSSNQYLKLARKYSKKAAYLFTAIAIIEVVSVFMVAISDGQMNDAEASALKDAITRLADTLTTG